MKDLKLFRRRYIPNEKILLKDDIILSTEENIIVTKWRVLKPRKDFTNGYSCYFIQEGFKVSKFFNDDNTCVYIYCDIIETEFFEDENAFVFNDLLIDVIIYENNFVKVVDIAEVAKALDENIITLSQAKDTLLKTDKLLDLIYNSKFDYYTNYLDKFINLN